MSDGFEKKLITPAGYVTTAFAVIALVTFSMFVFELGRRGIYALVGWDYDFHSIADTLKLDDNKGLLGWDRAFLLFAICVGAFYASRSIESFIEWAEKSPEQRKLDGERAEQVAAELRATEEAETERLVVEKAERKAARKPMSGWRRLWIVLSVVFGALAAVLSWQPRHIEYIEVGSVVPMNSEKFERLPGAKDAVSHCEGRYKARYAFGGADNRTYRLECASNHAFENSFLWALFPAIFMAAVGLIVRWIYRGFRAKPAP